MKLLTQPIILAWLLTLVGAGTAVSAEAPLQSLSQKLSLADVEASGRPFDLLANRSFHNLDSTVSGHNADQDTNHVAPFTPISQAIEDRETVQAIDDASEEFNWYLIPWYLMVFTADKLAQTAVAMTASPERWLKSRWAMDDPEYAAKYADGAPKSDVLGKLKQAADARFIEGSSGWYMSLGASKWANSDHLYASFEGGYEGYWTSYFTSRMGLAFAANDDSLYGGAEVGCRLQVPSRLAPFIGAGLFTGVTTQEKSVNHDNVDNDKDGVVDEPDETALRLSGLLCALYPEAGVHFWWTPRVRFSVYSRYLFTTDGRDTDTGYIGGSVALMSQNN